MSYVSDGHSFSSHSGGRDDDDVEARRKIGPHDRSIDNLVSRCRRVAAELGGTMDIETVRGVGYKLTGFTMLRPSGPTA